MRTRKMAPGLRPAGTLAALGLLVAPAATQAQAQAPTPAPRPTASYPTPSPYAYPPSAGVAPRDASAVPSSLAATAPAPRSAPSYYPAPPPPLAGSRPTAPAAPIASPAPAAVPRPAAAAPSPSAYWGKPPEPKKPNAFGRVLNRIGGWMEGDENAEYQQRRDPATGRTNVVGSMPWAKMLDK